MQIEKMCFFLPSGNPPMLHVDFTLDCNSFAMQSARAHLRVPGYGSLASSGMRCARFAWLAVLGSCPARRGKISLQGCVGTPHLLSSFCMLSSPVAFRKRLYEKVWSPPPGHPSNLQFGGQLMVFCTVLALSLLFFIVARTLFSLSQSVN